MMWMNHIAPHLFYIQGVKYSLYHWLVLLFFQEVLGVQGNYVCRNDIPGHVGPSL